MCEFLSGYVLNNGDIFCDPENTDSHSDMFEYNKIKDNGTAYYHQNVCRWEFTPIDITQASKMNNWELSYDEVSKPAWWDNVKEKVHTYAWQRIKGMIIKNSRDTLLGGCWILDGKKAKIKSIYGGRIVAVINGASLRDAHLIGTDLHKAYLKGADFTSAQFRAGANLNQVIAEEAIFTRASFRDTIITEARMADAVLTSAAICRSIVSDSCFNGTKMDKIYIANSSLNNTEFDKASIVGGSISCVSLENCSFQDVDLRNATLTKLNLQSSEFYGADIRETLFVNCDMFLHAVESKLKTGNTTLTDCHAQEWLTILLNKQLEDTKVKTKNTK